MNRIPYTITFICMEPSRPTAAAEVMARLESENLPIAVRLHAHESAELTGEAGRETIAAHVAGSDLIVVSHVLLDDEALPLETILRERARADAVVAVVSCAPALMRCTRIGRFAMNSLRSSGREEGRRAGSSKVVDLLRRVTKGRNAAIHLKDLMVLAPKLLRWIPGRMRDLRSYIECYLYLVESSARNFRSMVLMFADRYHAPLAGRLAGAYAPPVVYPQEGIHHPDAPEPFVSRERYVAWYRERHSPDIRHGDRRRPTVGLLLLRGDILMEERTHYDAVICAFESRGIDVIAAFGSSFDYRVAVERLLLDANGAGIDALVSLTAFPLVGGHVRSETAESTAALARWGVPYFSPAPLLFQTVDEWRESPYGLAAVQTALHVALPELDGAIEPLIVSGVEMSAGGKRKVALEERTERMVERVGRWMELRRRPNREKKVAITIFAFPPGKGSVGTAAYLDVFEGVYRTLVRLKEEGYDLEPPASPEELLEQIVTGDDRLASIASAEIGVAARLGVDEYRRVAAGAERVAPMWGAPPGALNSDGRDLLIHGRIYGNVFVGVQPSFGFEGDPMRLLFARNASPHHGFVAYYAWIERVFGADAVIHFGTHGAAEFMPGKQVGLDAGCWPDLLAGSLPNIYLYAINNPSEGTIAKRRSLATLVGYLTPPLENAGLYRELATLKEMVAAWREHPAGDAKQTLIVEALVEKVDQLHLTADVPAPRSADDHDAFAARLYAHLLELETRLIPNGLHVVGEAPPREELTDLLFAIGEHDRPERDVPALADPVAVALAGRSWRELAAAADAGDDRALDNYTRARRIIRDGIVAMLGRARHDEAVEAGTEAIVAATAVKRIDRETLRRALSHLFDVARRAGETRELDALVAALAGRYIEPAVGSDPVRNPDALPSGRNIHALDPAAVPSAIAVRNGKRTVELILAKSVEETGRLPERIGMVLWGLDNIKTHGEAIAQAFALIGVEPVPNAIGRVSRLRTIPLAELGRPRIDVTVQASGIFRDIFGMQIELLDEAIRMVAALDEPEEMNFVRRHTREVAERLGIAPEEAATRIFSNAAGAYGANVDHMVGMSAWRTEDDLAEVFLRRKSFAYGKRFGSHDARPLLEALASGIDTTLQNLDSSEVGITDVDHYFEYLGGLTNVVARKRGARPQVLVADTTTARAKVRTLEATIRLEARTKLLNPKWIEGMMRHGYQGVDEIRKRLDYTFGFSATAGAVPSWIYASVHAAYVADDELCERMAARNPHAYAGLVRRLIEANARGYWSAEAEEIESLRELAGELEDRIEGVG